MSEPKQLFKDDDPGTYDPKTKRHSRHHFMVNVENGDITIIGKIPPDIFIPEGWIKISSNRYVPTWPSCRYRRLNIQLHRHKGPDINAICIHPELTTDSRGCGVNHQICGQCKIFEAVLRPPILTDEEKEQLFKRQYRNDLSELSEDGVFHIESDEEYWNDVEEVIVREELEKIPPESPHHPKNARMIHIKWNIPCIHRYEQSESDCGGCFGIMCNNKNAEKFNQKITRRDCKYCPVAEPPKRK
jgi:hypothetical protein